MGTRLCAEPALPPALVRADPAETSTLPATEDIILDEERLRASQMSSNIASLPLRKAAADFTAVDDGRVGVGNAEGCHPRIWTTRGKTDVTLDDSTTASVRPLPPIQKVDDFASGSLDEHWSLISPLRRDGTAALESHTIASSSVRKAAADLVVAEEQLLGPLATMLNDSGCCVESLDHRRRCPPLPESVATLPCDVYRPGDEGLGPPSDGRYCGPVDQLCPGSVSRCTQTEGMSVQTPAAAEVCPRVMYTNRANLRHTIAVQQKLFRQQLAGRQGKVFGPASGVGVVSPSACVDSGPVEIDGGHPSDSRGTETSLAAKLERVVRKPSDPQDLGINHGASVTPRTSTDPRGSRINPATAASVTVHRPFSDPQDSGMNPAGAPVPDPQGMKPAGVSSADRLEWVVRKRSDGSRYVTRRPVRSARCARRWTCVPVDPASTTTDDTDAEQPALIGRYWTRDQRRQHVAERRQREAVKQMKRCARGGSPPGRGGGTQHHRGLAAELAAIGRHRQTPLLSVATV